MAAARDPKPGNKRYRRSDDELIADLKKKITDLENRKAARSIKSDPAAKEANMAFRALTRAVEKAKGSSDSDLKNALSSAQRTLADYFEAKGLKVPKARKPRARRKK